MAFLSNPRCLFSCRLLFSIQTGQTGGAEAPCTGDLGKSDFSNFGIPEINDKLPIRAVEEEQGEVILLLLRDPRIDPNQQVFSWLDMLMLLLCNDADTDGAADVERPAHRPQPAGVQLA